MEQDRQNPQPINMPPKPRAPGRGRRDPQAEEEDGFVENLRNDNVAWKRVRELFQERFYKDASEARLQMRLLRRQRERTTRWDPADVSTYSHIILPSLSDMEIILRLIANIFFNQDPNPN